MECQIRKWEIDDAEDLAAALNNKNIQDSLRDGIPYPYTEEDAKAFIDTMINADPRKTYAYAITFDDQVIGSVGIFRKENIHDRTAEMGYYIAQPYWGQGLGTSAVRQACDLVFKTTDIIRIFAEPFSKNTASCRILEKNGFVLEGVIRKGAVKNGEVLDQSLYALVK